MEWASCPQNRQLFRKKMKNLKWLIGLSCRDIIFKHMKVAQELSKLYYTIGEVAEMFDVSTSLIRHWETTFKELHSKRNRKGDRRFTVKDIHQLEQIYTLVKERGFTLEGAKKELKKKPLVHKEEVVKRLTSLKDELLALKRDL